MADARPAVEVTAPQRPRTPKVLIGAAALGLVLLVVGGVLFLIPQQSSEGSEPDRNVQIVSRATEFATQYNTYDAADLDGYQKRLDGLLTDEFATDNDKATSMYFEVLEPKKQVSKDPKVKSVAIESSDSDSAQVLVAVDATVYNTDLGQDTLSQMRWIVSMQKEDGEWRVDAFQPVNAAPATGQQATPSAPTPTTPSTGADQ